MFCLGPIASDCANVNPATADGRHVPLQVLRDQSSYSSWYFIEQASIGNLNANVTIALTSSVLSGRGGVGTTAEAGSGGLFSRVIGASGFQLINVNNVPLSLRGWHQESKLLGRNALINSIIWHYRSCAIQEAHKVCGMLWSACGADCLYLSRCVC